MLLTHPILGAEQEEEWQELQTVLQSGILNRAPNLRHFLEYVAEQHFAGTEDQIKEYSVAVHALHRLEQFDPQSDTIVRVTAHTLRKKLEQYYATEGAQHLIEIRLPAGNYALQFERRKPATTSETGTALEEQPPSQAVGTTSPLDKVRSSAKWVYWTTVGVSVLLVMAAALAKGSFRHWPAMSPKGREALLPIGEAGRNTILGEPAGRALDRTIRLRFGAASQPFVDVAGEAWLNDQYCKGGSTFSHPNREIQGTDDPQLFQDGREGKFQCRIPVPPGSYQLELLFADTAGDKDAARQVDLSINNAINAALDVVDEGGGDDVVIGKVYAGIHPMSDGTIHLDFTSDGSFVNAAELTPSDSDSFVPLRMLAGPAIFHDDQGHTWLPERFFQGGRRTFRADDLPRVANSKLFQWERYGHFGYRIPVVPGKDYKVRLYFAEGWFGKSNGGPGGAGSRVFDVYCNGTTLLKDFDISRLPGNNTVVITSKHVKPTKHGMLELSFNPNKNYPLLNAIEVAAEP